MICTGPAILRSTWAAGAALMVATHFLQKSEYTLKTKLNFIFAFAFLLFLFLDVVTFVTRSSRRYCNTGATLGRGGAQAHQSQGRGLNNRLKLL